MTSNVPYEDRRKTARSLYEQYGKPLEAEHTGEYIVISDSGKTILGKSLTEVVRIGGVETVQNREHLMLDKTSLSPYDAIE